MKKYSDFIKWLMDCPIPYEVDDLKGFDDDSIVFFTSKHTDKHQENNEYIDVGKIYKEKIFKKNSWQIVKDEVQLNNKLMEVKCLIN